MHMTLEEITQLILDNDFALMKTTQADIEFKSLRSGQFVYWQKRDGLASSKNLYRYVRLALHPRIDPSGYLNVRGVSSPRDFVHDSNLTQFPKKQHKGQDEIHHGIPIDIDSACALGEVLRLVNGVTE